MIESLYKKSRVQRVPAEKTSKSGLNATKTRARWDQVPGFKGVRLFELGERCLDVVVIFVIP